MLIVCPSCATSYDVKPASLSSNGRQVRCVRCRTVWLAEPGQPEQALVADIAPGIIAQHAGDSAGIWRQPDSFAGGGSHIEPPVPDGPGQDAGFEVSVAEVAGVDAASIAPADGENGFQPSNGDVFADQGQTPAEDIESSADRRRRRSVKRSSLSWPLSRLQSVVLALALLDVFVIGWRTDIVRAMPQTASFYSSLGLPVNLRGLTFDDVATTVEQHEGVPILVVAGNVFNDGRKSQEVPRLKFVVRNAARQEIYSWTAVPSRALLSPGEAVAFHTRLASPPPDAHDLILRFVNRHDIMSGTH
jgi:predicted Zn finger-like uncharacterized protein